MNIANQSDRRRLPRFVGSCLLIGLGFVAITASIVQDDSRILATVLYLAYLITCAILITTIISRLYQQHELRRMRFDLTNLILITTLIALPFGVSNIFWVMMQLDGLEELANAKTWILIMWSGFLTLLMFPVFFFVEAMLSWALLIKIRNDS